MSEASDQASPPELPMPIADRPTQPPPTVQLTPGELWLYEQLALRFTGLDDRVMGAMTEFHKTHTDLAIIKVDVESLESNVRSLHALTVASMDETTKNNTLRSQYDEKFRVIVHEIKSIKHRLGMNGDTIPLDLASDPDPKPPSGH